MAFSLSNGTSISSFVELAQNSQLSQIQIHETSDLTSARGALNGSRSDANCFGSTFQGANVTTSTNQTSTPSIIKNRGEQMQSQNSYSQQQNTLIQNATLAYPFLYPSYLPGFPSTQSSAAAAQYNYSSTNTGNGTMQNSQSSTGASNNRRGKKKVPATQSTNPELRLFFNLRKRDSQVQTNKGQQHIYKPKNPPLISEWFRRLSIEERINALSTVCPHLTETFISMFQRIEQSGQSSFARKTGPNSQEQKYFSPPSYMPAYPGFGSLFANSSSDQSMTTFDEIFYQRSVGEAELLTLKNSEKEKLDAEQEILKHIRLTDYQACLDTITISEELVHDADYFFKLMSYATNNQAFSSTCQFETKSVNQTSIEQPSWFKPKSFHTFATWILVALEENLWAHYNYDNNANLGSAKTNDLSTLFREKSDMGAQDVDLQQLAQFWRDTIEKDKKTLIDQFKALVVKEAEHEYNLNHGGSKSHKVVHSKQMQYSVQINQRAEKQHFQEQVDYELKGLVDFSLRSGTEMELLTTLMYTTFDRISQKQVNINRKFLDLIKKKFKDDLMENLLQEEYSTVKCSKAFKKKKKRNFNSNNQQATQSATLEKINQSSVENSCLNSDTFTDDQQKQQPKKKKTKQSIQDKNMNSQEQAQQPPPPVVVNHQKKKKNTNSKIRSGLQSKNVELNSCDEQQPKIEDSLEKEDTLESDNKNSSVDTKSSSNLFEIATAHQSNNSTTNSAQTLKSTQNDNGLNINQKMKSHANGGGQIITLQSSKSLDLSHNFNQKTFNDGSFKPQKAISKIESKNYQILQNSSNQDSQGQRIKVEDKKCKTSPNQYAESKIFSEDDARRGDIIPQLDHEYECAEFIDQYVLELTNSLINEVCRRLESEYSTQDGGNRNNGKQKLSSLLSSKLSPENEEYNEYNQLGKPPSNANQKYYGGKKLRKDSNKVPQGAQHKNHDQQEKSFRKKSFNSKKYLKEDKKFSEDYADSTIQHHALQQHQESSNNESYNSTRKSSTNDSYKCNNQQHQRKGFGIHLKNSDTQMQQYKPQVEQHERNHGWSKGTAKPESNLKKKNQNQKKNGDQYANEDTMSSMSYNTAEIKQLSMCDPKDDGQGNKKKRNKKKSKLTDTDIMNQFMKSLHQHNEEEAAAQLKLQAQNPEYARKKPEGKSNNVINPNKKPPQYKQQQLDSITEIQQSTSLKQEQLVEVEDPKQKPRNYKQRYSQRGTALNTQHVGDQPKKLSFDDQSQQATLDQEATCNTQSNQQVYQVKQGTTKCAKVNNNSETIIETNNTQQESEYSNKADCISDKSSGSNTEKHQKPDDANQNGRNNPFRYINFQSTANDCENTSFTDLTGTTNSAVDTSMENNGYNNGHSKYQSYQNTPSKTMNTNAQTFTKQQVQYTLKKDESDTSNYRTPPQLAKKQYSQQNYSHHGGQYRKANHTNSQHNQHQQYNQTTDHQYNQQTNYQGYHNHQTHNGNSKTASRTSTQYRQVNRPATQSNVYVQPMNISQSMQEQQQYMHTFMNPDNSNIFYQDQSMLMNLNPSVDTYIPKPQEQIFQYVEKNPMVLQQPMPCYSPSNNYQMNQYPPPQSQDMQANSYNYQRVNIPYFDQSQDLIFQIFNSIKSNHSMSPIPQLIASPPLLDFQMSTSSDLSFGHQQRQDSANHQETNFQAILDYQIQQFTSEIQENLNYTKPERTCVYNKLAEITTQTFLGQRPYLELFGSLITGLALESSDMDLAVTGLKIDDRFVMINELNKLADALQDWKCLESFKSIETASIPVIKLKVDLVKLREQEMTEIQDGDFEKRPIPENQRYLSVDITFDDSPVNTSISTQSLTAQDLLGQSNSIKTHLGLQSCALVQHYIQTYKNLKPVAILLKKFLAIHTFNSPYYGGISSYSTVILIVAYMNYFNLRGDVQDLTPSRLLMGFLDFYGNYFNPGSMGISVYEDGLLDSNFMILDPLNLQNNTTRNSYLTKEILLKFQCAFNNLKSLMFKLPQLQQAALSSQAAFLRANSQDQKSSIPFERTSPQASTFKPTDGIVQETSINHYVQNATQEQESGCTMNVFRKVPLGEEYEAVARNQALDAAITQQMITEPVQCPVNLLETFFAKESQPVTDLNRSSSSPIEPRGTQITMIEEAHAQ